MTYFATSFSKQLRERIQVFGGLHNAHLHIDRAGTRESQLQILQQLMGGGSSPSAVSIETKHSLIERIHQTDQFSENQIWSRTERFLSAMAFVGTTRADSSADVTADGLGLTSFKTLMGLKEFLAPRLDFRVGAYNPLGFRDDSPERWELLVQAAKQSDFLVGLPERDNSRRYPEHIGFDESVRKLLSLASSRGQELHLHIDQTPSPKSAEAERVLDILDEKDWGLSDSQLWFVHLIAPSTYSDHRLGKLIAGLRKHKIGVIICPSAAISMRQLRSQTMRAGSTIGPVLELLSRGVPIRLGSDNIDDVTSPAVTLDLFDEVLTLANIIRFYDVEILANLACGVPLDNEAISSIKAHIEESDREEAITLGFLA